MMWLAQHMVLWLGLSFALGLLTSVLLTVRRVAVERWEEVPPEPVAAADEAQAQEQAEEEASDQKAIEDAEPQTPFPVLEGAEDPAPWEQEELWSRPAKLARSGRASSHEPGDEWEEAATNWRTWAEEAAAKKAEDAHKDAAAASAEPYEAAADAPLPDPYGAVDPYGVAPPAREVTAGAGGVSARHRSPADELFARDREAAHPQDDELFARDRASRHGSGEESPFPAPATHQGSPCPEVVPGAEPSPSPTSDARGDDWRDPAVFEEGASVFPTVAEEDFAAPTAGPRHEDSTPDEASEVEPADQRDEQLMEEAETSEAGLDSAADLEPSFSDSDTGASGEDPAAEHGITPAEPDVEPDEAAEQRSATQAADMERPTTYDPVTASHPSESTDGPGGGFARPFRRKRRSELLRERQQEGEGSRPAVELAAPSAAAASAGLVPVDGRQAEEPREDTSAVPVELAVFDAPVVELPAIAELAEEPAADNPAVDEAVAEPEAVDESEPEAGGDPDEGHADNYDFSGGVPRPYGLGSAFAPADGSMPVGYGIKGQRSTRLFYPRGARFYSRVVADVYFDTAEAAEQAGFVRFDRRSSTAHVSLRPENLR